MKSEISSPLRGEAAIQARSSERSVSICGNGSLEVRRQSVTPEASTAAA